MKKGVITVVAALLVAVNLQAQEPIRFDLSPRDTMHRPTGYRSPDSLVYVLPWKPDYKIMEPIQVKPSVSMSSVVVVSSENMPARVAVINNNTLRMGRHFNLSNGQAWNYSPYPDAHLDARTLSFPMPR